MWYEMFIQKTVLLTWGSVVLTPQADCTQALKNTGIAPLVLKTANAHFALSKDVCRLHLLS